MNGTLDWIIQHNREHNDEYSNYVFTNKYLAILTPEHHRARKDGYVYLHQLQAERLLGRELNNGECVHHKDGNKYNNSLDNLLVFKTNSDHVSYHAGCDITQDGDVWVSLVHKKKKCPVCGGIKDVKADVCVCCYKKDKSSHIPSREELYDLLASMRSLTPIAEQYGVSTSAVKKWCIKHNLPYRKSELQNLELHS